MGGTMRWAELRMCRFWAGGISSFPILSCPRIPPATQANGTKRRSARNPGAWVLIPLGYLHPGV
jgi:hypothetical protein